MKALILASGMARRLKPLTNKVPKCLVEIDKKAILERIIDSLLENKVRQILITTGYYEEKIRKFMKKSYPQVKVNYIFNPKYDETNYIYSLWLARDALKNSDILYLHGDLFYNSALIKKILVFPHSGALVNKNFIPKKDFKAKVKKGKITEIGVRVSGQDIGFCLPIYKFKKKDWQKWMRKIDEYIKNGRTQNYAEDALNEIMNKINFYPVYFEKEYGLEIDDFEDLKLAKKILTPEGV